MEEPVRRSARSTKGQHSRLAREAEIAEDAASAKPARPRKKAKKENESDDSIICPCGVKEDNNGPMIECESCLKWQHIRCVFHTDEESVVPDNYRCPSCSNTAATASSEDGKSSKSSNGHKQRNKTIEDLNDKVRRSVAEALHRILAKTLVPEAKVGRDNVEGYSEKLALDIEQALYDELAVKGGTVKKPKDVGPKYRDKFRSISFNLRDAKNANLRNRVATGELSGEELVKMSNEDMSNPELQKLAQSVRQESIRESVLKVEEQGPRIRKTHKGEELIDMDEEQGDNGDEQYVPIEQKPPSMLPSNNGAQTTNEQTSTTPTTTANNDNNNDATRMYNMTVLNYDHDDDDGEVRELHLEDDDELDKIVNDKEEVANEEAKTDETSTSSSLKEFWTGEVSFAGITRFTGLGYHVHCNDVNFNGADSWGQAFDMSQPLIIDGRLDKTRADPYLQTVSASKTMAYMLILPGQEPETKEYETMFEYFHSRSKYGVIVKHQGYTNVKDAYLVPIGPQDTLPTYMAEETKQVLRRYQSRGQNIVLGLFVINPTTKFQPPTAPPHPPPAPAPAPPNNATMQMLQNMGLSESDLAILQNIIQANPQAAQDPQLLLQLLQNQQQQ